MAGLLDIGDYQYHLLQWNFSRWVVLSHFRYVMLHVEPETVLALYYRNIKTKAVTYRETDAHDTYDKSADKITQTKHILQ